MRKLVLLPIVLFILASCTPKNFVRTSDVSWSTIQIRDDLSYDKAWNKVIDVIAKEFEMEMIAKDGGYARTGWIYTWNTKNEYTKNYRNRIIIKFSPDRRKIDVKAEAQYGGSGSWKSGFDSRLLKTVKQDIMGVVGRTTM